MRKLFFLLLLIPFRSIGGTDDSLTGKYSVSVSGNLGFIIAHRPSLQPLQEGHIKGFDINVAKKSTGKKQWEQDFLFPETGLIFSFFDLATTKLGNGYTIYPYVDFPLSKTGNFHFRYGMGIGYIDRVFDKDENYKNAAIGSHWNGVIHFDLHYERALNATSFLFGGVGITHFSNGSFKIPNLGINIALMNAGFKKSFGSIMLNRKPIDELISRKPKTTIGIAGAMKRIYPAYGKQYYAATLSGLRLMPVLKKSCLGIGADLFYDNSIVPRLDRLNNGTHSPSDNFRLGVFGAYSLQVGNIGLMFNMGGYLYNKWKDDGNIYHRICLRYNWTKSFVCINLKTHYARADFFEIGTGLGF